MNYAKLSAVVAACICAWCQCVRAQDAVREIRWPVKISEVDFSQPTLIEVPASDSSGFFFPYYLYLPKDIRRGEPVRLLVEPNNTGTESDNFEDHKNAAKELASRGIAHVIADQLGTPLLVPVFPRPAALYVQSLNRPTLLANNLRRVDLQLQSMIQHASELLRSLGVSTKPKIFMDGFSASGSFANRFAALHPDLVRALAAGGINGLPIFPMKTYQNTDLPYPIGVADLKELTGVPFNAESYKQVSQYLYMGSTDPNDTLYHTDAWDNSESKLIAMLFGEKMLPDRWRRSQEIILGLRRFPIQTATYCCRGHNNWPALEDIVAFFNSNDGDELKTIIPHECPEYP